jgi:hypothetical protein
MTESGSQPISAAGEAEEFEGYIEMFALIAGTKSLRSAGASIACVVLGLLLSQSASAAAHVHVGQRSALPRTITQPLPQVTPQFNDPGPQIHISPSGNPVEQLAPLEGLGASPSSLGIK